MSINYELREKIALRESELDILGVEEHFAWRVARCPEERRKASRHHATE